MDRPVKHLLEFGPFRMDLEERVLMRDQETITLSPKAFETLLVLVQHSEHVVLKDDLMKTLWPDTFVEESNLSQHIFLLRKALGDRAHDPHYLVTVPGRGYRFATEGDGTHRTGWRFDRAQPFSAKSDRRGNRIHIGQRCSRLVPKTSAETLELDRGIHDSRRPADLGGCRHHISISATSTPSLKKTRLCWVISPTRPAIPFSTARYGRGWPSSLRSRPF